MLLCGYVNVGERSAWFLLLFYCSLQSRVAEANPFRLHVYHRMMNECNMTILITKGAGTVGGKDDGVLTTVMVGCGKPKDSAGVDLRIIDTEVWQQRRIRVLRTM